MLPRLRLKKTRRRLTSNSKGLSSIVGAVFAVLVMISLISTVFVWSLSQNTLYNNSVRQSNLADLDRSNERIMTNITCYGDGLGATGTVLVNGTLENDGPLSVQLVTLWVVDVTNKNYNHKALDIVLAPGNRTTLSQFLVPSTAIVVTLPNSDGDSLSCWFISARGNTISEKSTTIINNFNEGGGPEIPPYAFVSGGIGSIAMDFSSFSHYDNVAPANGSSVGSAVYGYTISGNIYTMLHVKVTNYDLYNRTLTITGGSMWAVTPFSGTIKGDQWSIANVTGGKLITGTYNQFINVTQAVDLYFGPTQASRSAGNIVPLFILLYGQATYKNGTKIDYGQNLPFIALNVT